MIKPTKRIAPWHLKKIFARGQIWRGNLFQAKYSRQAGAGTPTSYRLVVVIAKKMLAKAHERNLCRRRIKGAFVDSQGQADGWDIVIFPLRQAIDADFGQLKSEAKKCLERLRSAR